MEGRCRKRLTGKTSFLLDWNNKLLGILIHTLLREKEQVMRHGLVSGN